MQSDQDRPSAQPRRVLVVEDEVLVAMHVEDMLIGLGFEVVGPATRLPQALALARTGAIDVAVLDVNLNGETSFPVAEVLRGRGIPFLFATGYGGAGLAAPYRDVPTLQKPFAASAMARALAQLLLG